ncbi:MAG: hypothetical protein ABL958_03340 [Bdellovibrionia bacterium]
MKSKMVKKTLDVPTETMKQIQAIIDLNPGTSFVQITLQALKVWLENPEFKIQVPKAQAAKANSKGGREV